ncbi:FAD dependent oxidoreductase-domain-containing protein [Chaetomium sp. MPI-CAGE-AT-0009]|nr:FAD dependent oxidoreductase-domain-containing protein [Chaetomium sp. MPI-CAGE-AT-0009]
MSSPTVILGAGIIGVSTAYYLSQHQDPTIIHLVDPSPECFSSASGFAGGFLAKDWFGPSLSALGALSFEEHRRLAEEHDGRKTWGYSAATCVSYAASAAARDSQARGDDWLRSGTSRADAAPVVLDSLSGKSPTWLRRIDGDHMERISDEGTTAQVDPLLLCQFLLRECLKRGVKLHHPAKPVAVTTDGNDELTGIRIADTKSSAESELPCTRLVITAGSWTGQVFQTLFPKSELQVPISSLAGHSLVLKSPRHTGLESNGCHAIFTTHNEGFCPEMFSRLGGHIYFAGLNSSTLPLPDAAEGKATPYAESLAQLRQAAKDILGSDSGADDLTVVRESLCFRPITPWATPIVSRIRDQDLGAGTATKPGAEGGVFVAAGHGPWGIAMSLGTGIVLAEMAQGRELSADVSGLAFDGDKMKKLALGALDMRRELQTLAQERIDHKRKYFHATREERWNRMPARLALELAYQKMPPIRHLSTTMNSEVASTVWSMEYEPEDEEERYGDTESGDEADEEGDEEGDEDSEILDLGDGDA